MIPENDMRMMGQKGRICYLSLVQVLDLAWFQHQVLSKEPGFDPETLYRNMETVSRGYVS